jgi:hypothetical protein
MRPWAVLVLLGLLLLGPARAQDGAPAQEVGVGFVPIIISDIDIARGTYYLDGYLWFRWTGDIDPSRTFEIVNTVDRWAFTRKPAYEAPQLQPDGSLYQAVRISGRLHQGFDLADFPLDTQRLALLIEDEQWGLDRLVYVPDLRNSRLGDMLRAGNWTLETWTAGSRPHDYGTDFGMQGGEQIYSQFEFAVEISRSSRYFVWKLLLPLGVLLAATLASSLLPTRSDVRVSVPVLSLLAAVVLQQSYTSSLPEVGYLVLIDQIFVLAFLIMLMTVLRAVLSATRARLREEAGAPVPPAERSIRRNLAYVALMAAGFGIGTALIIVLR